MGSGTWERQGSYLTTGDSGGYQFVRFPNGESFNESTGYATLYFETGFYCNAGNFYGANFHAEGSSVDSFQVYGPGVYNLHGWTIQVPWNGYRHFWEKSSYTSYSSGYHESIVEFDWYPTLPTYSIQYNANGGQGAPSSQTKEYGTAVTLSSSVPTRENYNFVGWATSDSATTAAYQAGGSYTANASTVLYAVWELAFIAPTNTLSAYRVTAGTTTRNANGTQVYATVYWAANRINSSDTASVTSVTASITEDGAAVSPTITWGGTRTGASGQATIRFAANTAKAYVLTVTVTDSNGLSTVKSATVPNIKYPIYVERNTTNNTDLVKIEELALEEPLGAAYGGTGKTYGFQWQQLATWTGSTARTISLTNYSEVMVLAKHANYLGSAVIPKAALTTSNQELYLGGGITSERIGGRAFVVNIKTTQVTPVAALKDCADVMSATTWFVYAR